MSQELMKNAWREYIMNGTVPVELRKEIFDSWCRCYEKGIDPYQKKTIRVLTEKKYGEVLKENESLIKYGTPFINDLYKFVKGYELIISLSDQKGILLKIIGDDEILKRVQVGNFIEGADWSEESAGTNAIGTALYTKAPIQVVSYEHYCKCSQGVTCCCAPIKDENFNIIGFLNVTGDDDGVNEHTLGMAVASAMAIEYCLIMIKAEENCCISNNYKQTIIDSISQGIIAVDSHGFITHFSRVAKGMLQFDQTENLLGRNLLDVFPSEKQDLMEIVFGRKLFTDRELTLTGNHTSSRFSISSHAINNEGEFTGIVFILDEIQRVKKIAQRMTNAVASLSFEDLIGQAPKYQRTLEMARHAAKADSNVLLLGESGTGKDVIAQAIHNASKRKRGPFVAINCGAIPRELIASELFGYVEGAFTGARKGGSPGKFELSDGGTIFLDEIGEMPPDLQTTLLRVIEERTITRIGGQEIIPIDVRVIAATNKNLAAEIEKGTFRQDLYYRLNVIGINLPPLRERKRDIPLLIEHFYAAMTKNLEKSRYSIPPAYIETLSKYYFPGNIRELQNIVERSVNFSSDGALNVDFLPDEILNQSNISFEEDGKNSEGVSLGEFEKKKIYELMRDCNGNVSQVAFELNMARTTLYRKLKKYGITKDISMK